MTDREGLLDTSTLLLLPRITDVSVLPEIPLISVITLAELSVGPLVPDDESERARRLAQVQQAEADFDPIAFDAAAARADRMLQVERLVALQLAASCSL